MSTVGSLRLGSTIGQTAVGTSTAGSLTLTHGFWQDFGAGEEYCCVNRADVDHDGEPINISDLMFLVDYMFQSGSVPVCMGEADVDGDMEPINISDLMYLIDYMFQGGSAPPPCP